MVNFGSIECSISKASTEAPKDAWHEALKKTIPPQIFPITNKPSTHQHFISSSLVNMPPKINDMVLLHVFYDNKTHFVASCPLTPIGETLKTFCRSHHLDYERCEFAFIANYVDLSAPSKDYAPQDKMNSNIFVLEYRK